MVSGSHASVASGASPAAGSGPARRPPPEALLLTAERVIATHGLEGASLRQIAVEAGYRNPGTIQYHFGSKDGLVRAIVEHRHPPQNRRRLQLLDELDRRGQGFDIRGLLDAMTRPLLELGPDSYYVRLLARISAQHEIYDAYVSASEGHRQTKRRAAVALSHLPEAVRENRMSMATRDLMLNAVANRQIRNATGHHDGLSDDDFAEGLLDAMVAILCAPGAHGAAARL